MTREEFIEVLDKEGYSHEIDGDKIIVKKDDNSDREGHILKITSIPSNIIFKCEGNLIFPYLTSLADGIEFRNNGRVSLREMKSIPSDIKFNNKGSVWAEELENIPTGFEFRNEGAIFLKNIRSIPSGVKFNNDGGVYINTYTSINPWRGDSIDGIDNKRLVNLLIKQGMFI